MMIYEWFSVQRAKLPKIASAYHINGSSVLTFNVSFMIRFFLYYKDCTIYDVTLRVYDNSKLNSALEKELCHIHISCSLEINAS